MPEGGASRCGARTNSEFARQLRRNFHGVLPHGIDHGEVTLKGRLKALSFTVIGAARQIYWHKPGRTSGQLLKES
jgi:hypothetical protein